MILQDTFMPHLTYLGEADPADVALLYRELGYNTPWPRVMTGELLNPLSVIVHGMAQLSHRLKPDGDPLAIPEIGAMAQAVGMILHQFMALATIADVGLMPGIVEGDTAEAINAGMNAVAQDVANVLGYAAVPETEEEAGGNTNGEETAEATEPQD